MTKFTARFATNAEIDQWDDLVTANPNGGNMLQSASFASVKKDYGWDPKHVVLESVGGGQASYNLVLEKKIPAMGRLWYMIKGADMAQPADIAEVSEALKAFVKSQKLGVFAVKFEPDVEDTEENRALFLGAGLVKAPNIQPNDHTAILDTTPEPQPLLRTLHSRGRNAVRRAIREGAETVRAAGTEEDFKALYGLMNQVQSRNDIRLRPYEYYRSFWSAFIKAGQGRIYFAYEDGKPSVGAFVVNYGRKGTYKDGGSLPRRRQYGDSHLVQWQAILDLKEEFDIVEYDFCGTPASSELKNAEHPFYGLGLFKTSFTKTVVDFIGCYDLVIDPIAYRAWSSFGERVARRLWDRKHRQPFY